MSTRTWDAATYDRVSAPQVSWSEAILDRLELRGDELVLDAGCGSGRVTELLLQRLPQGRVIALDADADMVRATRERFAGDPRVEVVHQSLSEMELPEPVDAVFSGATFHWVLDHDELFARIGRATKPGGRISAQCGGEGNIANVKGIADRLYPGEPPHTWKYAGTEETRERLERNGFTDVQTWLQPMPVTPPEPLTFLGDVILGPYVQLLPEAERMPFAQRVLDELDDPPVLDYVRLNIDRQEGRLMPHVVVLPGDGIGPEVAAPAVAILQQLAPDVTTEEHLFGGASIDAHGTALTDEVLAACTASDAVLLAAVGGPKWDTTDPSKPRPEQGLLGLRKGMGLYANLRPVRPVPALYDSSPLKREIIEGTDLLVVRELTGGIYFGEKTRTEDSASDLCAYSVTEIDRIARTAFGAARRKVTSVDKANVLETSRLWRATVVDVAADFDVPLEHVLVDNAAMQLVSNPSDFDVIVTENMFGDILSDEAAMITGSIGMLPSASLGEPGTPGMFEPVHGSAPDIAGQGIANPLAMFLSVAMLLRHGLGLDSEAAALESAVDSALRDGLRTRDLGGDATTEQATQAVLDHLHQGS